MRSDILLVALAAVATAHPVPIPEEVRANIPRELQYSDLVAMTGPPDIHHWSGSYYEQDHHSSSHYGRHHHQGRHPHNHPHHGRQVGFYSLSRVLFPVNDVLTSTTRHCRMETPPPVIFSIILSNSSRTRLDPFQRPHLERCTTFASIYPCLEGVLDCF